MTRRPQMELKLGKMSTKELAEWFGISYGAFRNSKEKKLEELKGFASFEEVYGGVNITQIINPIYMTGIDSELLNELKANHNLVITLEDGILDGGFGEKIARFYGDSDMKVLNYGAEKEFSDRIPQDDLYAKYRLTLWQILEDILNKI